MLIYSYNSNNRGYTFTRSWWNSEQISSEYIPTHIFEIKVRRSNIMGILIGLPVTHLSMSTLWTAKLRWFASKLAKTARSHWNMAYGFLCVKFTTLWVSHVQKEYYCRKCKSAHYCIYAKKSDRLVEKFMNNSVN